MISETVPTDSTLPVNHLALQIDFKDELHFHFENKLRLSINGSEGIRAAIDLALQESFDMTEIFHELATSLLDITGRFLFSHGPVLAKIISSMISIGEKLTQTPGQWMILFYLAECHGKLNTESNPKELDQIKRTFKKAMTLAERDENSAGVFYTCLKAIVSKKGFLDVMYPNWNQDSGLDAFVALENLEALVDTENVGNEIQTSLRLVEDKVNHLANSQSLSNLSKHLDVKQFILALAYLAVKCRLPSTATELVQSIGTVERSLPIFVQKQFVQGAIILYQLDNAPMKEFDKRLVVLSTLAEAVLAACKYKHSSQLIAQGCLIIWNASLAFFPTQDHPRQLISVLRDCVYAMTLINSPLMVIRARLHFEIAQYYCNQDLIAQSAQHVHDGMELNVRDDPIRLELKLLDKKILAKNKKLDFSGKPELEGILDQMILYLNFLVLRMVELALHANELVVCHTLFLEALSAWIPVAY